MTLCTQCGTLAAAGASTCAKCGTSFAFAPPKANLDQPNQSWEEVESVRAGQRIMIAGLAINIVVTILAMSPMGAVSRSGSNLGFYLLLLGYLLYMVMAIWGCAKIMRGRGDGLFVTIVVCALMVVPQLGLVIMIGMSMRATQALRRAGYHVGFLGAKPLTRTPHVTQ